MFIYLVHTPDLYGIPVKEGPQAVSTKTQHQLYGTVIAKVIVPEKPYRVTVHPQNFIKLRERLGIEKLLIIDRVKGEKTGPVIQISDHRNLTGWNPLSGRIPLKELPQFPDMSTVYKCEALGIQQSTVSTVGPERFSSAESEAVSEFVAPIALCAAYVGIEVCALGWNQKKDRDGENLAIAVKKVIGAD